MKKTFTLLDVHKKSIILKKILLIYPIIITGIILSLTTNCKKVEPPTIPVLSTTPVTNITATTAISGGTIASDGGAKIIANGVCWSTNVNPAITDFITVDGVGIAQFVSSISGLTAGTTYHIRAYATNSVGTAYGADMSFSTLGQSPSCLTQPATSVSATGAILNGTVNANYLSTSVTFEYGTSTIYGQTITAIQSPITGNNITNVSVNISSLTAGTTYHFRVKTVNTLGTVYGDDMLFTTLNIPTLSTTSISSIQFNSAISGGNISSDGGSAIIARGVCWNTIGNPTVSDNLTNNGSGIGTFTSSMSGLLPNTKHYVRAYATNIVGTAYGNQLSFTSQLTDIEGNAYKTVVIGTQVWMAENLNTTKYSDGNAIPDGTSAGDISGQYDIKYYFNYNNSSSNGDIYGKLYTWAAAMKGAASNNSNPGTVQGVCPTGWHLPSDAEWQKLELFLGMSQADVDAIDWGRGTDQGGKLKEMGTIHWNTPNTGATNSTGFTALPGGARTSDAIWVWLNQNSYFWSSTENSSNQAWRRLLVYNHSDINRHYAENKAYAFSVRCIKD